MLILIVKLRTKSDKREEMVQLASSMLEPSRSEEGCISYDFFQSPFDKDSFVFVEKWKSREDLNLHFEFEHFKDFDIKVKELLADKPSAISYVVQDEEVII